MGCDGKMDKTIPGFSVKPSGNIKKLYVALNSYIYTASPVINTGCSYCVELISPRSHGYARRSGPVEVELGQTWVSSLLESWSKDQSVKYSLVRLFNP